MIALGPTDSLSAVAGTATAVTCTVFGDDISSNTDSFKQLYQGQLPSSPGTLIAATAGHQYLIKTILLSNTTGSTVSGIKFFTDGTAGANQLVTLVIQANSSASYDSQGWTVYDQNGQTLPGAVTSSAAPQDVTNSTPSAGSTGLAADAGHAHELAVMAANTIKGNNTGGSAHPLDLTAAQIKTLLAIAAGDVSGLGALATVSNLTGPVTSSGAATSVPGPVPVASIATIAADTVVGNPTGSTAAPIAMTQTQLTALVNLATTALPGALAAADFQHIPSGWIDVTRQGTNSMSTGATQAANTTAIGNIMTAAPSGSVLYFPPGWMPINKFTIPAKVFIFQGSGAGLNGALSAFTTTTDQAGDWISQTGADYYMRFRDIGFISQAAQSAGACINVNGNANNHIIDCEFTGLSSSNTLHDCITFGGANGGEETVLRDCDFTNFTGTAINSNCNLSTLVIDGITINGGLSGTTGAACGINVTLGGALLLNNSDIIGCGNNLLINPATTPVASVFCSNTYFDNSFGSCIKITGAGGSVRTKFQQCSMTVAANASPANAIEVSSTFAYGAVGMGLDIVNCNILNTFGSLGVGTGINVTGAGDFKIFGCNIAAWAVGIDVTPANSNGMTRPQIQGNRIGNAGGYGINTIGCRLNAGSFTYGSVQYTDNEDLGNTTALTDNSTIIATGRKVIAQNLGLVCAPPTQAPNTVLPLSTVTLAGVNVTIPANVRAGTKVRITAQLTNTGTIQVTTPALKFGTAGTNADATVAGLGLGTGTAAVGGAVVVAEMTFTSATTAIASVHTLNSVVAIGGTGTAGLTNQPSQLSMSGGATPAPATIATTSASFLGLYFSSSVASIVTIRAVEYEVTQQ